MGYESLKEINSTCTRCGVEFYSKTLRVYCGKGCYDGARSREQQLNERWMLKIGQRAADCHPNRVHYGKGLCYPCYKIEFRCSSESKARAASVQRRVPKSILKSRRMSSRYGIDMAEYTRLLAQQNSRCAVCGREWDKPLVVDHDHSTHLVRGLLCGPCNLGLGNFGDNLEYLSNALEYLRSHASV